MWLILAMLVGAHAQEELHHHHNDEKIVFSCETDQRYDLTSGMCNPLPHAGDDVQRVMVQANAFLVGIRQDGPRGRDGLAAPSMLMLMAGRSWASRHFFDVNLMLTTEKWTFPRAGYPQILQEGEENRDGQPYIDAQHPHSSPLMGVTVSDTIRLTETSNLTLALSPRGEATEGPVAFMHRPTAMVNPDVPLGHHIGQDVGHITSTVISTTLNTSRLILEASAFHGREPEPDKVDLPLGAINSGAARLGLRVNRKTLLLASYAEIHDPEGHAHTGEMPPDLYRRHSFSLYTQLPAPVGWQWLNTLVYGRVQNYHDTANLSSFLDETTFQSGDSTLWGRFETLERVLNEERHWVNLVTVGYTHRLGQKNGFNFNLGASVSKYLLPEVFHPSYGGDPWAWRIFFQVGGMSHW